MLGRGARRGSADPNNKDGDAYIVASASAATAATRPGEALAPPVGRQSARRLPRARGF